MLYVNDMLAVHNSCGFKGAVHITGGGFYENIPRVLPKALGCVVDSAAWEPLPVFQWLQDAGTPLVSWLESAALLRRPWRAISLHSPHRSVGHKQDTCNHSAFVLQRGVPLESGDTAYFVGSTVYQGHVLHTCPGDLETNYADG